MIVKPKHNRKLGLLVVSLTMARLPKNDTKALNLVRDELEGILIETDFYENTPFSWITLSIRFGLKDEDKPKIGKVSKRYGDLSLTIEIDTHRVLGASLPELCCTLREATLRSLIYVGDKYARPTAKLRELLAQQAATAVSAVAPPLAP